MSWHSAWRIVKSDNLKLLLILGLAFYIAFIPKLTYPYPVHIDEWVHLAFAKALMKAGSASFTDPFFGESIVIIRSNLEVGFHTFWGVFQSISGISWLTIFRYFPGIIFMFTVTSVYIVARREGFGWEAALFTCLIPTTVGIMGPAFLIPVAMGLLFVPLSLFVVFNCRTVWSYLVLFLFTFFLMAIHAPSAICAVILLVPYILLNLKGNFKHSLGMALAVFVPFLLTLPWTAHLIIGQFKELLVAKPLPAEHDLPHIIQTYGYLPVLVSLLGTAVLVMKGDKKSYGLVLGFLALLIMLASFFTLHYGIDLVYLRGYLFMILMMGIVAGAGLMALKKLRLPEKISGRPEFRLISQSIGPFLSLVLIGVILFTTIPSRQSTPYYNMIDETDYQAFAWIKDNVGASYRKAVLDPWKATPFAAITEKYVYTRIHQGARPIDMEVDAFLEGGCKDTDFLRKNNISVIYTKEAVDNPDLVEARQYVYLLKGVQSP